jgi:long-chain acyl-CoA synthetase
MIDVRPPTLPHVIASHAKRTPEAEAVVCGDDRLTWAELIARVDRVAGGLRERGLSVGDRVCVLMNNSPELLELLLGTIQAGGVIVPLSPLSTPAALGAMINRAEPTFLFVESGLTGGDGLPRLTGRVAVGSPVDGWEEYEAWLASSPAARPLPSYDLSNPVSVVYTSGTTGTPKGMEHSHFARLCYPLGLGPTLSVGRGSRAVLTTPMYHNGTWTTMLPALYAGGTVVIMRKFGVAAFQEVVERERCTHAFMVPTQLAMTIQDPGFDPLRLRSMEVIMSSGQPLTSSTFNAIRRELPFVRFCEMYGMGEGFMTYADALDYEQGKQGSVGRPISSVDTEVHVIDDEDGVVSPGEVGEIVGTSALLMNGYLGDPETTAAALWYDPDGRPYIRSGDLGRFDEAGYLYVVGRKKDVIISGGVKIHSAEIEEVFARHPDVAEAVAIGVPSEKWGETPLLLVVPRTGATTSAETLMRWGNEHLGKAERVARVEFREGFPRNALEKVLRRELRELYWRDHERDIG